MGTTVQAVPSQCSARGDALPSTLWPTAQASVGEIAATPRRSLLPDPMLGLATTDHVVPFHRSTSVRSALPANSNPTAHASVLESTATPFSSL
ncbi:MAG: hypothetical protein E6G47_13990 [Actinobacteria bacterium]|nr:MAG: hypothetical protein E6G47_13990 [Actinomycetota bacterium]